jgi:hypothetical protein
VNDARWTPERRDVTVIRVESPSQWAEARRLVNEYAASLTFDLAFLHFDREILSRETEYGPPGGCFLLAGFSDAWVGCGGVRRFSAVDCEMKRLYVSPPGRGHSLGRVPVRKTCTSLGFTRTTPYRYTPIEGATFWQLHLPDLPNA